MSTSRDKIYQVRWKHSFGLVSNFIRKTAPPKHFSPIQRGLFDLGRFGVPALGAYGVAHHFGLVGEGAPQRLQQNMAQAGSAAQEAAPVLRPGSFPGAR